MKKMKITIAATVALAACVGTPLFAQKIKCDNIVFAFTFNEQASVSTSASVANAGNFSQGPLYYKIQATSVKNSQILQAISCVLHAGGNGSAYMGINNGYYTSQAKLQLVQGELGGFWNINDFVAQSFQDFYFKRGFPDGLIGSFNEDGTATYNPYYSTLPSVFWPDNSLVNCYQFDAGFIPYNVGQNFDDFIPNAVDDPTWGGGTRISISDGPGTAGTAGGGAYSRLDTGRHFLPVPWMSWTSSAGGNPYLTTGQYPPGHMQPWGQVYVYDPGHKDSSGNALCENVTFFFDFEVQECYDCFYLNSFISTATFKNVPGPQSGPPCCSSSSQLTGTGTDYYYLTLDFDNTINNSFLNPATVTYTNLDDDDVTYYNYNYVGFVGVQTPAAPADGLTPDLLGYSDPIKSHLGSPAPDEMRFTLHGIVTYRWALKNINAGDTPDYVGSATYQANGYGFIGLFCGLIYNTAAAVTFTETLVTDSGCCDDQVWYDNTYNCILCNGQASGTPNSLYTVGASGWKLPYATIGTYATGWFGPGWDGGYGYFNPDYWTGNTIQGSDIYDEYDPYPYLNIVGGVEYPNAPHINTAVYFFALPYQFESPYNPAAALTKHYLDVGSSSTETYDYYNYIVNYYLGFFP